MDFERKSKVKENELYTKAYLESILGLDPELPNHLKTHRSIVRMCGSEIGYVFLRPELNLGVRPGSSRLAICIPGSAGRESYAAAIELRNSSKTPMPVFINNNYKIDEKEAYKFLGYFYCLKVINSKEVADALDWLIIGHPEAPPISKCLFLQKVATWNI